MGKLGSGNVEATRLFFIQSLLGFLKGRIFFKTEGLSAVSVWHSLKLEA